MAEPKLLGCPRARSSEVGTRWVGAERVTENDCIEMYAEMLWTKNHDLAQARLNPAEARHLALELLQMAEIVEKREHLPRRTGADR